MMSTARHEERRLPVARQEHRRYNREVRQMRAAASRVVRRDRITRLHRDVGDQMLDDLLHRPEMHRDVRRVHDEASVGIEERDREVESLLHVR